MRVKNKLRLSAFFMFAGTGANNGALLGPGQLSRELPVQRFYDERLQQALKKGLIEVQFGDEDMRFVGVAGIPPGVDAEACAAKTASAVTEPVPAVKVSCDPPPKSSKKKRKSYEPVPPGSVRVSTLARELKIPFVTLAAGLQKQFGIKVYPISYIPLEQADAMREKYAEKLEIPEISRIPSRKRAEVRTLSDLSEESDGILSLDDLISQNNGGGRK